MIYLDLHLAIQGNGIRKYWREKNQNEEKKKTVAVIKGKFS